VLLLLLAIGGLVIAGGTFAIVRGLRPPEGVRRLLDAPRVAIADAGDAADVRLEGKVEPLDGVTLEAPASGEPCVYFERTLEEVEDAGSGAIAMVARVVERRVEGVPFVLRDAGGYAIVDPSGATALLDLDHEHEDDAGRDLPTPMLRGIGFGIGSRRARRFVRVKEHRIAAGDTIVVIGRGVREPDPDPARVTGAYRDGPATRLRLTHSPQFPLHLLDRSRAPR